MQECIFEKNGKAAPVRIIYRREGNPFIINMEYNNEEPEYPDSFLSVVKVWKRLVMKENINSSGSAFEGSGTGAAIVLASCLWCRDHGVVIPSSIVLTDPCLEPAASENPRYFFSADYDDPCAFPLEAEYFGFPTIEIRVTEGSIYEKQAEKLCKRLSEQGISFSLKKLSL